MNFYSEKKDEKSIVKGTIFSPLNNNKSSFITDMNKKKKIILSGIPKTRREDKYTLRDIPKFKNKSLLDGLNGFDNEFKQKTEDTIDKVVYINESNKDKDNENTPCTRLDKIKMNVSSPLKSKNN